MEGVENAALCDSRDLRRWADPICRQRSTAEQFKELGAIPLNMEQQP